MCLQVFALQCLDSSATPPTYLNLAASTLVAPVIALLGSGFLLAQRQIRRHGGGALQESPHFPIKILILSVNCFFLFTPRAVMACLEMFTCIDVGGQLRLYSDMSIVCDAPEHILWMLLWASPAMLIYVGLLPGYVLYYICRASVDGNEDTRDTFGYLMKDFKEEVYWSCTLSPHSSSFIRPEAVL